MKVKYIIFLLLTLSFSFSIAGNLDALADKAYELSKLDFTKRNIAHSFCRYVYKYKKFSDKNVKDSIFVNILCSAVNFPSIPDLENMELKEKKKKYFIDLYEDAKKLAKSNNASVKSVAKPCKINGIVTDSEGMNNINFICVASNLLKTILNDYSKIGVYIAYGGFSDEDSLKVWEKDFFAGDGKICRDSYLNSSNDSQEYCIHKETYKYLKMIAGSLKQLLKSFELLKIEDDMDIYDKFLDGDNKFVTLVNKMYLEYYFYSLFVNYYSAFMQIKYDNLQVKTTGTSYKKLSQYGLLNEVNQANADKLVFAYSIKRTLLYMKNIYWTFPIHVGFLAIIEDFKKLRKHLAWIYTPIDQLRYKLENAQDEDKK